ncbi:NERD domain-containing protein [Actinomyces sp. 594]|uniref:nuclease-related domain-containing protein n=1 Tax=Actinomyces sp. 594 TaxID=2057793 RepID=UPI001C584665|nr:nuclease-related domain-containing protein [Actinomyces sp. 594]MBW3068958.1 NERD domain-containing protein [Actinomyces sp. 594]
MSRGGGFSVGQPGEQLGAFEGQGAGARRAGAEAERATAALLDQVVERGYVVFHSLAVAGGRADVDHLLVGSRGAVVIDSKGWRPGWYAKAFGRAWRTGGPVWRFTPGESTSMSRSVEQLRAAGVPVVGAVVAVWPAGGVGRVHTALMGYAGADAVLPARRAVRKAARLAGRGGAAPAVVRAVSRWAEANQ